MGQQHQNDDDQKTDAHICVAYGMVGFLRAILAINLAKHQYFSKRPSLFDHYHQITHSQQNN